MPKYEQVRVKGYEMLVFRKISRTYENVWSPIILFKLTDEE